MKVLNRPEGIFLFILMVFVTPFLAATAWAMFGATSRGDFFAVAVLSMPPSFIGWLKMMWLYEDFMKQREAGNI